MAQLSKVKIVKDTRNFKDDAVWGELSLLQNSHNDNILELNKLETESKEIGSLVEEGLAKVAAAVTNKGVYTESGASFATVAENIRKIEIGEVDSIFENEFITDEVKEIELAHPKLYSYSVVNKISSLNNILNDFSVINKAIINNNKLYSYSVIKE